MIRARTISIGDSGSEIVGFIGVLPPKPPPARPTEGEALRLAVIGIRRERVARRRRPVPMLRRVLASAIRMMRRRIAVPR